MQLSVVAEAGNPLWIKCNRVPQIRGDVQAVMALEP